MKKTFFIGAGLLLLNGIANGQSMENWNFSTNMGNCNNCVLGCVNISPGYAPQIQEGAGFPNWHVTHGSPNFPFSSNTEYPNDIFMDTHRGANGAPLGEGIAGGYSFMAGQTYIIGIGLRGGSSASVLHVALVSGSMPYSNSCGTLDCESGAYQGTLPAVNSANIVYLSLPSYNAGDNHFYFTPTQNYNWIWLYAGDANQCEGGVWLSHVYVEPKCREDLYLNAASITPGIYRAYKRIQAGSGSAAMSTINAPTQMIATETITLTGNLNIQPASGAVVAEINRYSCDYPPVAWAKPSPSTEAASQDSLSGSIHMPLEKEKGSVLITPNPTKDRIKLTMPFGDSERTITLSGINGNTLQAFSTMGETAIISLEPYPKGIYLIRISSGKEVIIKKVVKQ